jgi:alpha-1,6-mannosyltransferase
VLVLGFLLLVLGAGAPDSPLVPVLPAGVHPARWVVRGARWLGLSDLSRTQLTILAVGVVAGLLTAFAVILWEAWRERVGVWPVMATVIIVVGLAVAAPVLLSRDVYSYAAYGRILAVHGSNPYLRPPSAFPGDPFVAVASPEWIGARSVYGPGFTLMSEGIARWWSGSPGGTILAFKLVAGAAIAGAAFLASIAARTLRPGRGAAAAVVVGLNPVIVLHTVGGGHNDAIIALCFAGAFVLAVGAVRLVGRGSVQETPAGWGRGWRAFAVTLLLTLAVMVKGVVVPLLVLWLWQLWRDEVASNDRRAMAAHLGVVAGVSIALFVPVQAGWSTIRALLSVTSRQGWASGPGLVARGARAMGRAVGGHVTGAAFDAAVSIAFALLFLALFWRVLRRAGAAPDADRWGGTMLLLALAAPYLLPWYAAWFVPFLGLMRDRALAVAGLAAAALLALTGIPTEAGTAPEAWRAMLLAVHYAAAPLMLALLGTVASRIARLEPSGFSP